jgi:hypothetical protein
MELPVIFTQSLWRDEAFSALIAVKSPWGTGILWSGGSAPTQTTTANKCDIWSFLATQATSTLVIFGAQTSNF